MPRKPTGQIREHTDRDHVVRHSVRFRGHGYPAETIPLGRGDEGINRARAEHEVRLIASQVLVCLDQLEKVPGVETGRWRLADWRSVVDVSGRRHR